jgi:two-component system OmpR family response regulator
MRVLVIEDDKRTADYILKGLTQAGHVAEGLEDGRDGLSRAVSERHDVIVLDRMLPGLDGMAIIKALRASGNATPVLFLTAVGGLDDRVDGLEAGGDDYLVKPFAFSELMARLNALARRPPTQIEKTVLTVADLELDLVWVSRGRGVDSIGARAR